MPIAGDIDLTGWRKPISYYREMLFFPERNKLFLSVKEPTGYYGEIKETQWSVWPTWENWNWPGHEGKNIDVEIYSRYPSVRLYLNDKLIGEKATTREEEFKAIFTLPYAPGTLRVAGVENGQEKESRTLENSRKTGTHPVDSRPRLKPYIAAISSTVLCDTVIYKESFGNCGFGLYDIAVSVVAFFDFGMGFRFSSGRNIVHFPKNIRQ